MLKKGLFLLLFVLLFKTNVFAGDTGSGSQVYFYENIRFSEDTCGRFFFLFSKVVFDNAHSGDVILINSPAVVHGEFDGDIYCLYASVDRTDRHTGQVYDLSSPFLMIPFKILIFLIIFSGKKSFFEQGSIVIWHSPFRVLRYGLMIYFMCITLAAMFMLSVIGFPISLLILAISYVMTVLGEISLAILIGYFVLRATNQTFSYANMMAGAIIMESIGYIPVLGALFSFLLLPIFCFGIVSGCIIDGYIKKIFYPLPYRQDS